LKSLETGLATSGKQFTLRRGNEPMGDGY